METLVVNEHPAFFGDGGPETPEAVRGIPADLLAYVAAADEPDELALTDITAEKDEDAEEAERTAALRALLEASILLGPDPSILSEIEDEVVDEDFAEDAAADKAERAEHERALDAAAESLALAARVDEIYQSIVERAPEHKVQPSTARVEAVLDVLGDPQDTYPIVHVAGTNGKTSTARMIDALLTAMGMRVGRFTSPHLVDVRERVSIEGEPISRAAFVSAWEDVAPYIDWIDSQNVEGGGARLSFFEVFAVMAMAAFADHPVDAAVLEVGMGGRWDATNVVNAQVAVITPISRDHEKWLGSELAQIGAEKAGIIKEGQIVVISEQEEEVLQVLLERAAEVDAVVRLEGRDFEVLDRQLGVGGQMITVRTPAATYEDVFVPLLGDHQAHNAAAAIVAAESFIGGRQLDARLLEEAMVAVSSPGRMHIVRSSPTIVVDAAHNPAGARALAAAMQESFDFRHVVGVFSAMGDKDVEGILAEMEPHLEHLVLTPMQGERAMDIDELRAIAEDVFGDDRVDVAQDLVSAIDQAAGLAEASTDPADKAGVLVFGSVMLAGAVLELIDARKG